LAPLFDQPQRCLGKAAAFFGQLPTGRGRLEGKQLGPAPDVVGQVGGNRRGAWDPAVAVTADPQFDPQAMMRIAEVVQAADQVHAGGQGVGFAGQGAGAGAAGEGVQPLAKCGIEPLDKGRVDPTVALTDLGSVLVPPRRCAAGWPTGRHCAV